MYMYVQHPLPSTEQTQQKRQRRMHNTNNHPLGGKPLVVALFAPGRYYFIVNAPVFLLFLCFNSLRNNSLLKHLALSFYIGAGP